MVKKHKIQQYILRNKSKKCHFSIKEVTTRHTVIQRFPQTLSKTVYSLSFLHKEPCKWEVLHDGKILKRVQFSNYMKKGSSKQVGKHAGEALINSIVRQICFISENMKQKMCTMM